MAGAGINPSLAEKVKGRFSLTVNQWGTPEGVGDVQGVTIIGMALTFAPMVIAAVASLLQRLFENAQHAI